MAKIKYTVKDLSGNVTHGPVIIDDVAGEKWKNKQIANGAFGDEGTYTIEEEDVTAEVAAEEAEEAEKKAKKQAAIPTLQGIALLDLTKKEDIDLAIRAIVEYLEIKVN